MFIATAITNQSKLRRSETKGAMYSALLRSCERKPTGIYKHFIPTDLDAHQTCSKKQEVRPLLHRERRGRREKPKLGYDEFTNK